MYTDKILHRLYYINSIPEEHCTFENNNGVVKIVTKPNATCFVNGRKVEQPITLKTGSRVILGKNHVFRFNHPEQVTCQILLMLQMMVVSDHFLNNVKKGQKH